LTNDFAQSRDDAKFPNDTHQLGAIGKQAAERKLRRFALLARLAEPTTLTLQCAQTNAAARWPTSGGNDTTQKGAEKIVTQK